MRKSKWIGDYQPPVSESAARVQADREVRATSFRERPPEGCVLFVSFTHCPGLGCWHHATYTAATGFYLHCCGRFYRYNPRRHAAGRPYWLTVRDARMIMCRKVGG
jgi:hypothetical protein